MSDDVPMSRNDKIVFSAAGVYTLSMVAYANYLAITGGPGLAIGILCFVSFVAALLILDADKNRRQIPVLKARLIELEAEMEARRAGRA